MYDIAVKQNPGKTVCMAICTDNLLVVPHHSELNEKEKKTSKLLCRELQFPSFDFSFMIIVRRGKDFFVESSSLY